MNKSLTRILQITTLLGIFFFLTYPINAQRRNRPGNLKHSDSDVENVYKREPVKCTYIKDGAKFYGEVYILSGTSTAKMKMGTATLSLYNGKYKLRFEALKYKTRDALSPDEKWKYNPWRYEKMANDFTSEGTYITYKQNNKIFLHMEDDKEGILWPDSELENVNAKGFGSLDDNILFAFEII